MPDIVDTIRKDVTLTPRGDFEMGACPFCHAPDSLAVSPRAQLFHCYECKAGGNVAVYVARKGGVETE